MHCGVSGMLISTLLKIQILVYLYGKGGIAMIDIYPPAFPTHTNGISPKLQISVTSSQPSSERILAYLAVSISQKVSYPVEVPLIISLLCGSNIKDERITSFRMSVLTSSESSKSLSLII